MFRLSFPCQIREEEIDPIAPMRACPPPSGQSGAGVAARGGQSTAPSLRHMHRALPSRECGDAAARERHDHHALEQLGDRARRRLHCRASARRCGVLAARGPDGQALGAQAALLGFAVLLRGILPPSRRNCFCFALCRRSTAFRRGARRARSGRGRGPYAQHRRFQSLAGGRHRRRHRRPLSTTIAGYL